MVKSKIKIGISSCLLGEKVRYNGDHKRHWYINEILGQYFDYVPFCPEVEVGMGVPRPSVRLVGTVEKTRMIDPKSGKDWTEKMVRYSKKKAAKLEGLHGFILKKGSPSCGPFRVKLYGEKGIPFTAIQGLFAKELIAKYPHIPIEDEGRLNDEKIRENFLTRIFAYARLCEVKEQRFKRSIWVKFHQDNKMLLLAHGRPHYTKLGRLVAHIKEFKPSEFVAEYEKTYMEALENKSSPAKNSDVLLHILGHLKTKLGSDEKQDILMSIDHYKKGTYPLVVPLTLIRHYVKIFDIEYIKDQTYLCPHPLELKLRNHT